MQAFRWLDRRPDRRLLLVAYVLLGIASYSGLRLQGSAGPVNWWGLAIWVFLLWMVARGSRGAWLIAVALSLLGLLSFGLIGITLTAGVVGVLLSFVLQTTVLVALYPDADNRLAGAKSR